MSQRIFADDWRDCLREQYKSVIRQQDVRTEATLTEVLYEVGFTHDELAALKFEATLRADDMPDDFVPEEVHEQYYAGVDVPAELIEPVAEIVEMAEEVEEAEPESELPEELLVDFALDEDDLLDATEPDDEPDQPQQLSMF